VESGGTGRCRSGGGQNCAVAHCQSRPGVGAALGRQPQRDGDAESAVAARPGAPEAPTAQPAEQRKGKPSKRGFAARVTGIAQAHPKAERFEIWSQTLPGETRSRLTSTGSIIVFAILMTRKKRNAGAASGGRRYGRNKR